MKRLEVVLKFRYEEVCFDYQGEEAVLLMVSKYTQTNQTNSGIDCDDLIFSSKNNHQMSSTEAEGTEEEPTLIVGCADQPDMQDQEAVDGDVKFQLIFKERLGKHDHLLKEYTSSHQNILIEFMMVTTSLKVLRPSSMPFQHTFDPNVTFIYHYVRRTPQRRIEIAQMKTKNMSKAGIIVPASPKRSFLVVVATKKETNLRFCVAYLSLDKKIKTDGFPVPQIQDIFHELEGGVVISTLDLFSSYWQIRLAENCIEKKIFVFRFGIFKFEVMKFGSCTLLLRFKD